MKTKIIILTAFVVGMFLFGLVGAEFTKGNFDSKKYKLPFSISDDFTNKKIKLDSKMIYNKIIEKLDFKESKEYLSFSKIDSFDLTKLNKNYFTTNSQNITRFRNG